MVDPRLVGCGQFVDVLGFFELDNVLAVDAAGWQRSPPGPRLGGECPVDVGHDAGDAHAAQIAIRAIAFF